MIISSYNSLLLSEPETLVARVAAAGTPLADGLEALTIYAVLCLGLGRAGTVAPSSEGHVCPCAESGGTHRCV
eukprot:SAG31_NODE_217_length_19988_cov_53.300820_13_plen_73_part_00